MPPSMRGGIREVVRLGYKTRTHPCAIAKKKPTFLSAGSLLDQVYVKQFLHDKIKNEAVSVYYSEHDFVETVIRR